MKNILKFRYFLILFLSLAACRNEGKTNTQTNAVQQEGSAEDVKKGEETSVILFFGNSLTAGYQLDPEEAFPARIQEIVDSVNLKYTVVNAGLSGETTASGRNRLDWILKQQVDVFVLELGGNDGLRGIPLTETRDNLQAIIDMVRARDPEIDIVLAGMQIPPNMGQEYTTEFRSIFPALAEKNDIPLIPFLLEGVGGIPELNLEDGIHPNPEGHKIVAMNVWRILEPVLQAN